MDAAKIERFVMRYLEATGCRILEKTPARVTVKLSPQADRELTNRPYYWNFVERTGAEAETMAFTFVFEPDKRRQELEAQAQARNGGEGGRGAAAGSGGSAGGGNPAGGSGSSGAGGDPSAAAAGAANPNAGDSILARYLGVGGAAPAGRGRIPEEPVDFGSRKLAQLFEAVKARGRFVQLYEEPSAPPRPGFPSSRLYSWLGARYRVDEVCDRKRSRIFDLGISLSTGEIVTDFYKQVMARKLTPRLPPNAYLRETISLERAMAELENRIFSEVAAGDHEWAREAQERLQEELARVEGYYEELLASADEGDRPRIEEQYASRRLEIDWQHRPRVESRVVGCGFYHLSNDSFRTF